MSATPDELMRHAGSRIKAAREAAGLSQQQVAERIGMTRSSVANLEAGRQDMTITRLAGVAAALRLDLAALIPPEMLPPPIQPLHKVTIQRVYEVTCETCGGAVIDAPAQRAKAEETRRDHIAAARDAQGGGW